MFNDLNDTVERSAICNFSSWVKKFQDFQTQYFIEMKRKFESELL